MTDQVDDKFDSIAREALARLAEARRIIRGIIEAIEADTSIPSQPILPNHENIQGQRPPKLNLLRIEEWLSVAHLRLAQVYIEHMPYQEGITRYDRPTTFFYLDPPYFGCEDYYGKNLFAREDFQSLADQLSGISGRFLLSLNDKPEIREVFGRFEIEAVITRYSCNKGQSKPAGEVLIRNY